MGIAIWHFAIFIPDRFWAGVIGSFLFALFGAVIVGFVAAGFDIPGQDAIEVATALEAIPGALIGLGLAGLAVRRSGRR